MPKILQEIIYEHYFVNELVFHFISKCQAVKRICYFSYLKKISKCQAINFLLEVDVLQPEGVYRISSLIILIKVYQKRENSLFQAIDVFWKQNNKDVILVLE